MKSPQTLLTGFQSLMCRFHCLKSRRRGLKFTFHCMKCRTKCHSFMYFPNSEGLSSGFIASTLLNCILYCLSENRRKIRAELR